MIFSTTTPIISERQAWKKHKKVNALIAGISSVLSLGVGIGLGFGILVAAHSCNNNTNSLNLNVEVDQTRNWVGTVGEEGRQKSYIRTYSSDYKPHNFFYTIQMCGSDEQAVPIWLGISVESDPNQYGQSFVRWTNQCDTPVTLNFKVVATLIENENVSFSSEPINLEMLTRKTLSIRSYGSLNTGATIACQNITSADEWSKVSIADTSWIKSTDADIYNFTKTGNWTDTEECENVEIHYSFESGHYYRDYVTVYLTERVNDIAFYHLNIIPITETNDPVTYQLGNGSETASGFNKPYCEQWGNHLVIPRVVKTDVAENDGIIDLITYKCFYKCNYLTGSLHIPFNAVTTIEQDAFTDCIRLSDLSFDSQILETIGDGAFEGCTGLTGDLSFPNSIKTIGNGSFFGCSGLDDTIFWGGANLQSIGSNAFSLCSNLNGTLTIYSSVTSVGDRAFYGCSGFTKLIFNGFSTTPSWAGENIFSDWYNATEEEQPGVVDVNVGSTLTAADALVCAKEKGLPDSWTVPV